MSMHVYDGYQIEITASKVNHNVGEEEWLSTYTISRLGTNTRITGPGFGDTRVAAEEQALIRAQRKIDSLK